MFLSRKILILTQMVKRRCTSGNSSREDPYPNSRTTSVALTGRADPCNPTAAAACPITSAADAPAARSSLTPASALDLLSFWPDGLSRSGWWRNCTGTALPSIRAR